MILCPSKHACTGFWFFNVYLNIYLHLLHTYPFLRHFYVVFVIFIFIYLFIFRLHAGF